MSLSQRPENFTIDYSRSLAQGLVFAGLGSHGKNTKMFYDSSPFKHHGTLTGNLTTGYHDGRMFVKNPSSGHIAFPYLYRNPAQSRTTIACWVLYPTHTSYDALWWNNTLSNTWFYNTSNVASPGIINRIVTSTTSSPYLIRDVILGEWHHYAFTISLGTGQYGLDMFINGRSVGAYVGSITGTLDWTTSVWTMFGGSNNGYAFVGSVKDFMLWEDRALTLPEIQQLADPSNVMLSGLIRPPKRKYYPIVYNTSTAHFLFLKQNNRFLSLQKI